jgi:hypothetical protein
VGRKGPSRGCPGKSPCLAKETTAGHGRGAMAGAPKDLPIPAERGRAGHGCPWGQPRPLFPEGPRSFYNAGPNRAAILNPGSILAEPARRRQ